MSKPNDQTTLTQEDGLDQAESYFAGLAAGAADRDTARLLLSEIDGNRGREQQAFRAGLQAALDDPDAAARVAAVLLDRQ